MSIDKNEQYMSESYKPDAKDAKPYKQLTKQQWREKQKQGPYVQMPEEEPEIRIIPAIERLEELKADFVRLRSHDALLPGETIKAFDQLYEELTMEAIKEFQAKWGL